MNGLMHTGERFDLYGSVVYGIMLFCVIFGMLLLPDPATLLWIFAGVCAFAIFIWWEKRCTSPLLNLSIFSGNRTFLFSNIAAMINYGATFAVAVLLSLYLQYIQGIFSRNSRVHPCCPAGCADDLLTRCRKIIRPD